MNRKCGYPLCKFYSKDVTELVCPTPVEGIPCQGTIEDTDEMEDCSCDCRCEICRFWS